MSLQYFSNDATFSEGLGRLVNDERATKSKQQGQLMSICKERYTGKCWLTIWLWCEWPSMAQNR